METRADSGLCTAPWPPDRSNILLLRFVLNMPLFRLCLCGHTALCHSIFSGSVQLHMFLHFCKKSLPLTCFQHTILYPHTVPTDQTPEYHLRQTASWNCLSKQQGTVSVGWKQQLSTSCPLEHNEIVDMVATEYAADTSHEALAKFSCFSCTYPHIFPLLLPCFNVDCFDV